MKQVNAVIRERAAYSKMAATCGCSTQCGRQLELYIYTYDVAPLLMLTTLVYIYIVQSIYMFVVLQLYFTYLNPDVVCLFVFSKFLGVLPSTL